MLFKSFEYSEQIQCLGLARYLSRSHKFSCGQVEEYFSKLAIAEGTRQELDLWKAGFKTMMRDSSILDDEQIYHRDGQVTLGQTTFPSF